MELIYLLFNKLIIDNGHRNRKCKCATNFFCKKKTKFHNRPHP